MCSSLIAPSSIDNPNIDIEVWKNLQFFSPLLDEFAIARLKSDYMDEFCLIPKVVDLPICATTASLQLQRFELHKRFTYICKTSCNNCCVRNFVLIINIYDYSWVKNTMSFYDRCCLITLLVQQRRTVKTDDIYIYHAYTLASLLPYFKLIKGRGRLKCKKGRMMRTSTRRIRPLPHLQPDYLTAIDSAASNATPTCR